MKKLCTDALNGKPASMKLLVALMSKMPIKDSDMLVNEAFDVIRNWCDAKKAEGTLDPEIDEIYLSATIPIETKKRGWNAIP